VKIRKQELEQRMEHFKTVCRESGVKLTHQRMEIFREVAQTGDHPDAEKVHTRVRMRLPTVSLDTIYRTLWLLNDLGMVTTLGSNHERTRFDANLSRHHHFVCIRCGLTLDFCSDELDNLRLKETLKSFGTVESAQVEVHGVCHACSLKEKKLVSIQHYGRKEDT
jgi:Fur family transcriptional regulator, peroxide stress response regulator